LKSGLSLWLLKVIKIIAEAKNSTESGDITGHAEINVIRKALKDDPEIDFSKCSLYSNFEPCAMCSFIIRDLGIGEVVFSVSSPHLGGYSKWNILENPNLDPEFTSRSYSKKPKVMKGIMEEKASEIFDKLVWRMHKK
jgi:tRNA(adenine34) deaminase